MKKQIELVNDIIFNAIMHGADAGGSYESNYDGLVDSIKKWLDDNYVIDYKIKEVERKDSYGYIWGVVQIVKE